MISPTGQGVRIDSKGSGEFLSMRGIRLHRGTDFLCTPGQPVVAPIKGTIHRVVYPYEDDLGYSGIDLYRKHMLIRMFYLFPNLDLIGQEVEERDIIGVAQDISKRYDSDMQPHIHVEVYFDPGYFAGI